MTTKSKTAAELLAELRQNPEFSARAKLRDEQNEKIQESSRNEQIQLLSELKELGILVGSVWDLVNSKGSYSAAIPILIRHLSEPHSGGVKEGIVRALTIENAGPEVLRELIKEFVKQNDDSENSLKWVLGNAIATVAKASDADTLVKLATDRANGKARDMIISSLPRVVKDKARLNAILDRLANDKDVREFVDRARSGPRS
jgi:hypothetical protein